MAQTLPQIALRLSFNAEANRYQVIATPSFSARNFTWGPSQISVVLPAEIADQTLSIRSLTAGSWADNSTVYAPASLPTADFHGITSQGDKLDLVAGQEYVLFDFDLKPGYVDKVRLYDVVKDPGSAQAGMKGGDFRSYMSDNQGVDYLKIDSQIAALVLAIQAQPAVEPQVSVQAVAYPNPSASGKFRLYLKGFGATEKVTVRLLNANGVLMRSFTEAVSTLGGREIDAGESTVGYTIVSLEREGRAERLAQKVWFR